MLFLQPTFISEKAGNVGQCHETEEGGSLGCEERPWPGCRFEAVTTKVCLSVNYGIVSGENVICVFISLWSVTQS